MELTHSNKTNIWRVFGIWRAKHYIWVTPVPLPGVVAAVVLLPQTDSAALVIIHHDAVCEG